MSSPSRTRSGSSFENSKAKHLNWSLHRMAEAELTRGKSSGSAAFELGERKRQAAHFAAEFPDKIGYRGFEYRLLPAHMEMNLSPSIRDVAKRYFGKTISWHTHANHALSSQVCCLNFLMPLAERPALLARLVSNALRIPEPEMIEVERGPDGRPWFVGFE